MKNIRLTIAYDGGPYLGWQDNGMGPSIEGELKKILNKILQKNIVLQAASRTDRGVHARGQVINFFVENDLSLEKLVKALNSLLPKSIVVIDSAYMPLSFHPTLDQTHKEYCYYICFGKYQLPEYRNYSWHCQGIDLNKMNEAAKYFIGEHDFTSFCNQKNNESYLNHIRTIYKIKIEPMQSNRVCILIDGNQFLYKMVRNIVGTLVYVGIGKLFSKDISSILEKKKRSFAGITAPSHGLFLEKIYYD